MIGKKTMYILQDETCSIRSKSKLLIIYREKMISSFYETAIYVYVQSCKDILFIEREKKNSRIYELIVYPTYLCK